MRALHFLLDTLGTLYCAVLLIRLLMQLTRADFRNPVGRAVMQITNPLVMPLRKLLPPAGKLDSATIVALILCTLVKLWLLFLLLGIARPGVPLLLQQTVLDLVRLVLNTYLFSIVLNAILSFVAPGNYSPVQSVLASICDPVLKPFRRLLPPVAGFDLSPLWACIAIQALLILLP